MLPEGFGEVAEKLRRSTVQVSSGNQARGGSGSGIIWDTNGTVITNAHVAREEQVRVELWDGRSLSAEVAARDAYADLVKLRLRTSGLSAAAWRESSSLRPGELAVAVGNPLGFVGALTTGVVHGAGPVRGLGRRTLGARCDPACAWKLGRSAGRRGGASHRRKHDGGRLEVSRSRSQVSEWCAFSSREAVRRWESRFGPSRTACSSCT